MVTDTDNWDQVSKHAFKLAITNAPIRIHSKQKAHLTKGWSIYATDKPYSDVPKAYNIKCGTFKGRKFIPCPDACGHDKLANCIPCWKEQQ